MVHRSTYYEIHIIVQPNPKGAVADHETAQVLGRDRGFWSSVLETDASGEERPRDVIMTTREDNSADARRCIPPMVGLLSRYGHRVTRYKIEHVVLDSKRHDELNLGIGASVEAGPWT